MKFTLETSSGMPIVRLVTDKALVANDLATLHKIIKAENNLSMEEGRWLGLCCVMFAAISLSRWGNQLNQTNISKALDQFYFSFSDPQVAQAFQEGENEGVEAIRQAVLGKDESNIVHVLAAKLGVF